MIPGVRELRRVVCMCCKCSMFLIRPFASGIKDAIEVRTKFFEIG